MELKDLAEKLNAASTEIKNANEAQAKEIKELGAASAETKSALEKSQAEFAELKGLFEKSDAKLKELELKGQRPNGGASEVKSLGEAFTESEVGMSLKSDQGLGRKVVIEKKDITSGAASAGALIRPDRDSRVFQNPNRPMRIRDLIPTVPTSSNAVEVMRENVFTNNAAPQAGELVTKAKSEITYELLTYPVRTIAHYVHASKQVLSDAPMLQSLINGRLTYGLDLESDWQLLLGDGTGQNLAGVLVDSDISDIGEIANGTTDAELPAAMIDHIRAAVTECQKFDYYNMNGLVMNPVDFATLETAKATDGHYILVPFAATNSQTTQIWRVPVVITNAMPKGAFLIGDWTMGAVVYDRESVSVAVAEQHGTNFIDNAVTIRGEERYTLGIPLPKAFCKGQFTVAAA
ncbi:major capsid protein [Pseudoalteromonas phage PHS21]|nr:major capsid protein [Pseudoalteromonas phage PHS21]